MSSDSPRHCTQHAFCVLTWEHPREECFTEWDQHNDNPKPPPPTAPPEVLRQWKAHRAAIAKAASLTHKAEMLGLQFRVCRDCGTSRWERGGKDCECIPF